MTFEINAADIPALTDALQEQAATARKGRRKFGQNAGPAKVRRRLRDAELARMVADGSTLQAAADTLGFKSRQGAQAALERFLARNEMSAADMLRQTEGARLETAVEVVMGIITESYDAVGIKGLEALDELDSYEVDKRLESIAERLGKNAELKLKAMDRLVSLGGRAGKVFGYDAPTKVEGSGMGGDITVTFAGGMEKPPAMAEPAVIIEPQV